MGPALGELGGSLRTSKFGGCLRGWCIVGRCKGILRLGRVYVSLLAGAVIRHWQRWMRVDSQIAVLSS